MDETWWMEAKYSQESKVKYLTRFRLDATIVSSLFHRKVSKLIFVTNIEVRAKTISDIRVGLQRAIGCQDVRFATKSALEYWLSQNPEIYLQYFPAPAPAMEDIKPFFVSDDIEIYPYPGTVGNTERCINLYEKKTYQAYFKLISDSSRQICITRAQSGIKILLPTHNVCKGENSICVPFLSC